MAGLWQRTGNVTVTNGSKTITGFGTKWKTGTLPIQKGHAFYGPDNAAYEVDTVVSDTEIFLVDTYRGGTLANQPYRIDITRTSTISQFAADLASLVAKYRSWFDGMMTWLTGSGDVAILNPDTGANVTIPSWKKVTSEGEGQAARAKVEADRSKAEADRALTEADRAAGIVATAALPLPDVWAPFSDSLRLITGYGREVKVGEDVVARMVNFSRSTTATYRGKDGQLKTAAVNEPRFEREGLLIEGPSTNMIPISNFPQNLASWSTPNPTGNLYSYVAAPDGTSSAVKVSFAGDGFNQTFPSLVVGTDYTFSFYAKNETATDVDVSILLGSGSGAGAVRIPANTAWSRYSVTRTFRAGDSTLRWYFSTKNVEVSLWGVQLEAAPFASSYIPTAGAAATRSADYLQFVGPGNHPDILSGVPFTFAMRMSCEEAPVGAQRDLVSCPNLSFSLLRRATNTLRYYRDGTGQLSISSPGKAMNVVAVRVTAGNVCTLRVGSNQASRTETAPGGGKVATFHITNVAGHVRDFRIWQHAVTDEQFKAIA